MNPWKNKLYYGDNLRIMPEYLADESVDLIYLDPPFNSKATYNVLSREKNGSDSSAQITAFDDTWHWDAATAAEKLNRRWIGVDITHLAITLIKHRLEDSFRQELSPYEIIGDPKDLASVRALAESDKFQFEWWTPVPRRTRRKAPTVGWTATSISSTTRAVRREKSSCR